MAGIGAAIIAGLGLVLNLVSMSRQKKETKLQHEVQATGLRADVRDIETQMLQTQSNIGLYEEFLGRYPAYAQLEQSKYETSGEIEYKALMENLGMQNVLAGARGGGGVGTTRAAVGEAARSQVATFAGEDLALGGEAGLYEKGLSELLLNLGAEQRQAEGQLDILRTTLTGLGETKTDLEALIKKLTPEGKPVSFGLGPGFTSSPGFR